MNLTQRLGIFKMLQKQANMIFVAGLIGATAGYASNINLSQENMPHAKADTMTDIEYVSSTPKAFDSYNCNEHHPKESFELDLSSFEDRHNTPWHKEQKYTVRSTRPGKVYHQLYDPADGHLSH